MGDDFWEGLSVERAFSAQLIRTSAENSLERLVIGNVDHSQFTSNINRTLSPQIVLDSSKRKSKIGKKVKFAETVSDSVANNSMTKVNDDEQLLTLDDALYDVRKFSITGYKGDEREEAKVQLAVKLGAKRPKAKCINYNQLKEQRKLRRVERLEKKEAMRKDIGLRKAKGGKVKKNKKKRSK